MAEIKESREFPLHLSEAVWVGGERIEGVFDRIVENRTQNEDGEWEIESVQFRQVNLKIKLYNPRETNILVTKPVRVKGKLDRIAKDYNPRNLKAKWRKYRPGLYAAWEDKCFRGFDKDTPQKELGVSLSSSPEQTDTDQPQSLPVKEIGYLVSELLNRPDAEGSGGFFSTARFLDSKGITDFWVKEEDGAKKAVHSVKDLTCVFVNPKRDLFFIFKAEPDRKLSNTTYTHSKIRFTTIYKDEHPAVLE